MKKPETNSTDKVLEVEYTEKDIQELRDSGIAEDELPKAGIKKYRRSRFVVEPTEAKVKITMWLDGDILQHFKQRSELPNAAPYQTQINNELRKIVEQDLSSGNIDSQKVVEITQNKEFIRAVAEQLKELVAT